VRAGNAAAVAHRPAPVGRRSRRRGPLHLSHAPTTLAEHRQAIAYAEQRLGRKLTLAEKQIDLVAVDRELKEAKLRLAAIIDDAKNTAIRRHLDTGGPIAIRTTDDMRQVIDDLYAAGQRLAAAEIYRLTGQQPAFTRLAAADPSDVEARLQALLHAYSRKLTPRVNDLGGQVGVDLGTEDVAAAAFKIPGSLDVASRIVSTGMFAGMGDVYDANSGLFGQWQYSAVMDAATCDVCAEHDGDTYDSWEEAMTDLPDGGPNPDCDGDGRCRCRLVPVAESVDVNAPLGAPPPGVPETPAADFEQLPEHAQQAIETLTVAQARDQLSRLQKYVRPLRQHVKKGTRSPHPNKIPALERRIDALKAYIKVGGAGVPEPQIVVQEEATIGRLLRPLALNRDELGEAARFEKVAEDFISRGKSVRVR
jgi:hypothetical protein